MSEALKNLLGSNADDSPEDGPSQSNSYERTIPTTKSITRKISKGLSASTNRLDSVRFTIVRQDDSNEDNISIASEGDGRLNDLKMELSNRLGSNARRPSMTAPSSPIQVRRNTPQKSRGHLPIPHFPHLPHIPHHISHLLTWRDIKGRWGSGFLRNESLHRAESMVSLCFQTLANFIVEDNLNGLQSFLGSKQIQIDDRDDNGCTALMLACQHGRPAMVSELLAHGADPNAEDNDGWTALLLAAKHGRLNICSDLLDHGANIHQREMGGWTPLMWASYKGYEDIVTLMLEKGADVNAHGNYHISSLIWAAGRGHSLIVERLLAAGARPNNGDKYGTTALVWAARKGDTTAVRALLAAGATPDQVGMYSWTALLQATHGNRIEIVQMLLEHKPNVNALDKDGCSALAIACKEGFYEIAVALLNSGAYINIQDRLGDTCLIQAVKGGHKSVVEALLKKYADVDVLGKDRKTAVYTAVEKGHAAILKLLLQSNPDLELATKDGDTALLRAVRSRNADMVQMLLDKKARVNAADKKGDTCLHIAMRARSKAIVEILLRTPKNSHLLYRPNKAQETPYNIDASYPKTIMSQIFGASKLNNTDNENSLGYELYSSALADMLAEPSLTMPITVGLYARWGSGKSFLISQLKDEMKTFGKQWTEIGWSWNWAVGWGVWHTAMIGGTIAMIAGASWIISLSLVALLFVLLYVILVAAWYASERYEWSWPSTVMLALGETFSSLKLVLQVVFCHPPGPQCTHSSPTQPVRFHFTDQAKSSTQEGEASVIHMLVSLSDALENQYGRLCTRLYRAFRPKPLRSTADWRWRRVCCIPHLFTFELCFIFILFAVCVLAHYLQVVETDEQVKKIQEGVLIGLGGILSIAAVANLYTWGRIGSSLFLSPRARLKRSVNKQPEGFLQALRPEVTLLTDLVKCLDAFTGQQTRLVVVVDALDSCEQDKVLIVLNAIHTLCSEPHSPFVIVLAIDPHIISKAVEVNSRRAFSESNIGGWDYLKNMVQLPFYLQNSALQRVKIAQQTAFRKQQVTGLSANDDLSTSLQRSVSARRLSSASELMSSQEKLKGLGSSGSSRGARKLKISESVASSMNSNLHKVGLTSGPADLSRVLLTDDYFNDVNPRSMRRLMNVLYITGRLLKAFQIDFNWYHLASWVNLTEQWPFRTSWIILHHEMFEEHIDDSTPLKQIYDKVRPNIPVLREVEPLMELDRDERKLDVFLGFHRMSLLAADLKIFLPFTINLDPYIKKVIKDEQQHYMIDSGEIPMMNQVTPHKTFGNKITGPRKTPRPPTLPPIYGGGTPGTWPGWPDPSSQIIHHSSPPITTLLSPLPFVYTQLSSDLNEIRLSKLSISGLCSLVEKELPHAAPMLCPILNKHNVSGKVLRHCDLGELKQVLNLNFGDWELFRILILGLRDLENGMPPPSAHILPEKDRSEKDGKHRSTQDQPKSRPSNMEKQVTLEEQMICGALQTLNEEAMEDVLGGDSTMPQDENESLQLVLPGPITGWQGPSPPASLTASPQGHRKADPSILKSKGSMKQPSTSKKHVSINERNVSCGSDSSLKYSDLTPVIVRFEDETIKHNTQQYYTNNMQSKCDNVFDFGKITKTTHVDTSKQSSNRNDSTWTSNNTRTDMDRENVTNQDTVDSKNVFQKLRKKSLPSDKLEDNKNKSNKKRPSSLLLSKNDELSLHIDKDICAIRSRSADESSPKNEAPPDITLEENKPKQAATTDNVTQTSSVEIISRLRDKIFNKCPSTDRGSKSGDMESDDESTPLVSSERSSPSVSLKAQRETKEKKNCSKHNTTSSSSDNNSSKGNSPIKAERKRKTYDVSQAHKMISPDKYDCNISDATISVEFSPCSDRSSSDSNIFNLLDEGKCNIKFHDIHPVAGETIVRESATSRSQTPPKGPPSFVSVSASVESLSYLLEPHGSNMLSHGSSDASMRSSNLTRQDAIEEQDWKNPESNV